MSSRKVTQNPLPVNLRLPLYQQLITYFSGVKMKKEIFLRELEDLMV